MHLFWTGKRVVESRIVSVTSSVGSHVHDDITHTAAFTKEDGSMAHCRLIFRMCRCIFVWFSFKRMEIDIAGSGAESKSVDVITQLFQDSSVCTLCIASSFAHMENYFRGLVKCICLPYRQDTAILQYKEQLISVLMPAWPQPFSLPSLIVIVGRDNILYMYSNVTPQLNRSCRGNDCKCRCN